MGDSAGPLGFLLGMIILFIVLIKLETVEHITSDLETVTLEGHDYFLGSTSDREFMSHKGNCEGCGTKLKGLDHVK